MADVFCTRCGHRNPASSNFCASCGAVLEGRPEDHTISLGALDEGVGEEELAVTLEDLPDGTGMLLVKRGPGAGSRFQLDAPCVTLGRHPDSDIFLDDVTVSRRHAEILRGLAGYVVRDVGSLNGTYLNRERIEGEAPIADGDELQVGRFKLVFLVAGPT